MVQALVFFKFNKSGPPPDYGLGPQVTNEIQQMLINAGLANGELDEIHLLTYCSSDNDPDHISFVFSDGSRLRYNTAYCQCRHISSAQAGWADPKSDGYGGFTALRLWDKSGMKELFKNIVTMIIGSDHYQNSINACLGRGGKNKSNKIRKSKKRKSKKRKSKKRKSKKRKSKKRKSNK